MTNLPKQILQAGLRKEWWRGASIYQIYPRSFSDSNGDGIGDLAGIVSRLDYVASLGVNAVWLSPFFASPMKDFGYDVADYCSVDPIFGELADFDALIEKAHILGLKVLIDQVYSHTSDLHPWFSESRASRTNAKADWYVWADSKPDGSPPSNWQSVFGGPAWTWDARRQQYYMHNFLTSQPQLNCHNIAVQDALLSVASFWLDRGVDGFRVDAINFAMHDPLLRDNPPSFQSNCVRTRSFDFQQHIYNQSHPDILVFIERIRALTDSYGDRFTVAEVGGTMAEREMKSFTAGNTHFNSAYGFNFLYADALTPALVREVVETWQDEPGVGWPSWAFSNHDAPRWISRWAQTEHRASFARMAMLLFVCLRGNIIIWQGEELGLTQVDIGFDQLRDPEAIANWPLTLSRDGTRTPMPWETHAMHCGFTTGEPWLPLGPDHASLAVDSQNNDADSLLVATRKLLAFRSNHEALLYGSIRIVEAKDQLLVFERMTSEQHIVCAFNFGLSELEWHLPQHNRYRIIETVGDACFNLLPAMSGIVAIRFA
jgi:alpha-glucosidase